MTLESDAKFEKKLAHGFKNNITNLVNFNASSDRSENLHFDVLLLSILYKLSAKKVLRSYLSWNWRVIQTWEMWWILTRAVENPKICTLMGYFCQKYVMFELKWYRRIVSWKMAYGVKNDIRNLVNFHTSSWK